MPTNDPGPTKATGRLVYFVQADELRLIKIGVAGNLRGRLAQLRTHCPDHLRILGVQLAPDAHELERKLHKRFATARVRGEWFKPTGELLSYIARRSVSADPYLAPLVRPPKYHEKAEQKVTERDRRRTEVLEALAATQAAAREGLGIVPMPKGWLRYLPRKRRDASLRGAA